MQFFKSKEDLILDSEKQAKLAEFLLAYPDIWEIQQEYFQGKMTIAAKSLAADPDDKLDARRKERIAVFDEIIKDFKKIKQKGLKVEKNVSTLKVVQDFFFYVKSQDIKMKDNTKKLTAEKK